MTARRQRGRPAYPDILTPAEWRVAHAARHGLTNRQIAERQRISIDGVKFHLANILLKLGIARRRDLVGWPGMPLRPAARETEMTEPSSASGPLVPPGFTRLFPYIFAANARDYLDFLAEGLGGETIDIHASPDGVVRNAHVRFGDTTIMVSEASEEYPPSRGTIYLYVADAEAAMDRAIAAGGEQVTAVGFRPYGENQGGVRDPSGNIWWLSQRLAPGGY